MIATTPPRRQRADLESLRLSRPRELGPVGARVGYRGTTARELDRPQAIDCQCPLPRHQPTVPSWTSAPRELDRHRTEVGAPVGVTIDGGVEGVAPVAQELAAAGPHRWLSAEAGRERIHQWRPSGAGRDNGRGVPEPGQVLIEDPDRIGAITTLDTTTLEITTLEITTADLLADANAMPFLKGPPHHQVKPAPYVQERLL